MKAKTKESAKRIVSALISFAMIASSLISPLGFMLYPQAALASAPAPTFGGPNEGQTGVPKDAPIDRVFDQALDVSTVTTATVLLQANTGNTSSGAPTGSSLCSSVSLNPDFNSNANRRITCGHSSLSDNTWYTATFKGGSSGIKNGSAEALVSDFLVHFQTGSFTGGGFTGGAGFSPPPIVTGTVPGPGGTLPINGKLIVTFNPGGLLATSTMATAGPGSVLSPTNILLVSQVNGAPSGSTLLTGSNLSWNNGNKQLIISPTGLLTSGNGYVLIIKNTTQNTDGIGLPGPDYVIPFNATAADVTGPDTTKIFTFPADAATGVDRAVYDISVSFNEPLDAGSVTSSTVQLIPDANSDGIANDAAAIVQTRLDGDGRTVHLSPLALLAPSKLYFIKILSGVGGVKDLVGNAMSSDVTKSFTTGTNINGAGSDTTKPFILFANGTNFGVDITYSEPMNSTTTMALGQFGLESPLGTPVNLAGAFVEYKAFTKTTSIRGLAIAPGQTFKVTVASTTQDLSGNGMDLTGTPAKNTFQGTLGNATQSGPTSGGGGGGAGGGSVDFFTLGTNPIQVMPDSALAGATSQYRVAFQAAQAIPAAGKIVLTFPDGFTFAGTCGTKLDQFDNNDINGPSPNTVTFTPVCDSNGRTITLTTSGGATNPNDFLRLKLQGIINSNIPKDFSSGGYTVDIKTFDASNNLLDSKTSMPFFLATPGSQSISGFIYNDTNKNDTKDGGETGVNAVNICLGGPMIGFNCTTTDATGAYSFGSLSNGFYHLEVPPITSGSISATGGLMFRDINLSGGSSQSGVNFGLKASDGTITVNVSGGPASKKIDIIAFNPFNASTGGNVIRELLLDGSGAGSASLPVSIGKWQVTAGPWIPITPGVPPPPPVFDFMPPTPQEVNITSTSLTPTVTFSLQNANRSILGAVLDGTGTGIANVFVGARPANAGTSGGLGGAFTQTKSDGTFTLNVVNGTYDIEAHIPGMPFAAPTTVTVQDNVSNADGNTTADVYSNGALITGTGISLKIQKAGNSISGKVLDDSGNAVAYAFVKGDLLDASSNQTGLNVGAPTDSSGNYTLYVSSGTWKLRAFAPGFGDLGTQNVTMSGSNLTGQNFQATTANFGAISGTVTVAGTAQAGAFVNVFGPNGGNGTVTGSDGTFSIKVKTGSGYTLQGFVPGKGPLAPVSLATVTSSGLSGQNLTIAGTGTINITITGISDAYVDARDASGNGFGTSSNASGVYSLTLPASSGGIAYTVKAQNPKYGLIGSGSQSVTLTSSGTQAVSFTAPTLFTVSGTISSSATACIAGVSIFLSDATNGRRANAITDSAGAYSIQLPSGTYSLMGGKPGCIDSANPSSLTVTANVSTGTNRTMTAADSTITGRVTLNGTNTTTPTKVFADNGSGKYVAADVDTSVTGSSNNYTLNVTGGTWTVKARSDGFESSSSSVTVSSGGSQTQNLALSAISGFTVQEAKPFNVKPSDGGLVTNSTIGSGFVVNVPAGALGTSSNDATISTKQKTSIIDPPTDNINVLGGKAIEITPTDASGNKISTLSGTSGASVTITIPYSESDIPSGVSESKLQVGTWSDEKQAWEALPTTVDTVNNLLTATVTHFSDFAPIASIGGSNAPSAPSGSSAGSPGLNSTLVTWTSVSGATGYNIYRDTSSGGSFPRVGSDPTVADGSATSFTDTGLTCATTYYYKVSAKNSSGESAATTASSVTTLACNGGGGGGGVSGGGGGTAPSPAPAPAPTPAPSPTPSPSSYPYLTPYQAPAASPAISGPTVLVAQGLKAGSKGSNVTTLQAFLESKGLLHMPKGVVKGYFGASTKKALMAYQKSMHLKATGTVDAATQAAIQGTSSASSTTPPPATPPTAASPGLKLGNKGQAVVNLQAFLESKGLLHMPKGVAKGYFGASTKKALMAYQKSMHLKATGMVDAATQAAMAQ